MKIVMMIMMMMNKPSLIDLYPVGIYDYLPCDPEDNGVHENLERNSSWDNGKVVHLYVPSYVFQDYKDRIVVCHNQAIHMDTFFPNESDDAVHNHISGQILRHISENHKWMVVHRYEPSDG